MKMACVTCGTNYETATQCVCPFCGSGIINQMRMDDVNVFRKKSDTYKSPGRYVYRPKKAGLKPEFVNHSVEEYTFIEDYEQSPVLIDYLCFTVKLSDFRHCKKDSPYSGINFPEQPEIPKFRGSNTDEIESINRFYREIYTDYLQETLRRFIQYVLGFNYGCPRGKGFQFYEDSFVLTSSDSDDYCGQVGIGGNRDTVHFQITGHGCKHLFAQRSCRFLHHWISTVLCCKHLSRIDLAFDDYDNLHTCEAAEKASRFGAFKRSRGFSPKVSNGDEWDWDEDGNKVFSREERNFGSRQSNVYWRIYNKKLERKIEADDFHWYRSEVELKKVDTDILLNPVGHFVALNEYAASLLSSENIEPVVTKTKSRKRVACDVLSAAYWAKRQYGRLVTSLLKLYNGDFEKVVTTLQRDSSLLDYPEMHRKLINALE